MRGYYAVLLFFVATPAVAEEFVKLNGTEITSALTDQALDYGSAWQEFRADGRTLYRAGSESLGNWRVDGDKYCSQWPPRSEWACYCVESNGDSIRFIGAGDDVTTGKYDSNN